MLYHDNFGATPWETGHPEFVHKLADQKNASSGYIQKVFLGQRVWQRTGIESLPFVSNMNFNHFFGNQKLDVNFFSRVFLVAVINGVDDGFVYRHLDMELSLFVKPGLGGNTAGSFLSDLHVL